MKNLFVIIFFLSAHAVWAQMPRHIGNFPLFQQYYNPALTAYDYSALKMFYRNQWRGFEDAPRSIFLSGELDPSDLRTLKTGKRDASELDVHRRRQLAGHHAAGFSFWHNSFGAFAENQVNLNYSARVSLSKTVALRAGGSVSYCANRLNTGKLSFEQANDPVYNNVASGFYNAGRIDVNVGLAVTHEHFYFGYALQDAVREGMYFGDDFLRKTVSRKHFVQAGARKTFSEGLLLVVNGLFGYDKFQRESVDVQVKSIFLRTLWAGAGYRHHLAYTATAGFIMRKINICYLFEMPMGDASRISDQTHEIALTFNLIQAHPDNWRQRRNAIVW